MNRHIKALAVKMAREREIRQIVREETEWKIRALLIIQFIEAVGLLLLKLR